MNFNVFMALVVQAETEAKKSWADYSETDGLPPIPKSWSKPKPKPKKTRGVVSVPLGAKKA